MIDPLSFLGNYVFRRISGNIKELCVKLTEFSYRISYVLSFGSLFYRNVFEGNRELLDTISKNHCNSVELRPLASINPQYTSIDTIKSYQDLDKFRAIVLAPQYHGFKITSPRSFKLIFLLENLGYPVIVLDTLEDQREWHRAYIYRYTLTPHLVKEFLETLRTKGFKGKLMLAIPRYELVATAASLINTMEIYVDVSHDSFYGPIYDRVKWAVENVGEDLIVLSLRYPLAYTKALLSKVLYSDITEKAKQKIITENPQRFYSQTKS